MSKLTKRYLFFGVAFCLWAILFALLYYFKVIKNLTLTLALVYVGYFVGIALLFNCAYCKKNLRNFSALLNGILGAIFLIGAIVLLIIGLTNGQIQF